jgi:hypothetical protein
MGRMCGVRGSRRRPGREAHEPLLGRGVGLDREQGLGIEVARGACASDRSCCTRIAAEATRHGGFGALDGGFFQEGIHGRSGRNGYFGGTEVIRDVSTCCAAGSFEHGLVQVVFVAALTALGASAGHVGARTVTTGAL